MDSGDDQPDIPEVSKYRKSRKDDMVRYSTFQKFPKLIINF